MKTTHTEDHFVDRDKISALTDRLYDLVHDEFSEEIFNKTLTILSHVHRRIGVIHRACMMNLFPD